jgi:hypothetical protein
MAASSHPLGTGSEDLVIREVASETVIYDRRTKRAHCLGRTAAAVWRAQDGHTGARETARLVSESLQEPVNAAEVRLVWRRLRAAGLRHGPATPSDSDAHALVSHSRRTAIRLGAAALMVLSVATRSPAQAAATCLQNGSPCQRSSQCCNNCCNANAGRCTGGGPCTPG